MSAVAALKYGRVTNLGKPMRAPFAASQTFHRRGGAFCIPDSSGYITAALAASGTLSGWWEVPGFSPGAPEVGTAAYFTTSSTAGTAYPGYVPAVPGEQIRVPIDMALTVTMFGEKHDLVVTSTVQYADLDAASTEVLIVLGSQDYFDAGIRDALVTYNPLKITAL